MNNRESRYELLFNSSNDAIFVHTLHNGKHDKFTEVNDIACSWLGYSREQFLDLSLFDIDAGAKHNSKIQALETLAKTGIALFEMVLAGKSGNEIPVEMSSRIFERQGERYVLSIARDISERKLAEAQLRDSEAQLDTLLSAIPIPVFYKDRQGRYLGFNKAFEQFYGTTRHQLIGRTVFEINSAELAMIHTDKDNELFETGGVLQYESQVNNMQGEVREVILNKAVFTDRAGAIGGLIGTILDITERKKAQLSLGASESLLRSILENIELGVALISPKMEILELNHRMRQWFPSVDPIRRPICYRAFNDPPRETVCDYCPTCQTLQDGLVHEATTQTPQAGVTRNYRIVSSPLLNASGEVTAAIEMVEDITERLSLESQLRQAQKMEAVGRLAGGVAHDINNMLGVILGRTELAMYQKDSAQPLITDLQEIHKAAERSADLTRQLLGFARKQIVAPRVLDLNATVEKILKMLGRLIGEDIDLAWLPGSGVCPIKMDPSQVDQILANLCVNARDAIDGTGKITIETASIVLDEAYCATHVGFSPGVYAILTISDDGCGIDREILNKIFEPFFTTKEKGKGTGLGLATVYGIVKQNNGFINVYSEPGQGTAFKIYLPQHLGEVEPMSQESPAVPGARSNETILLVEDDPAMLEIGKIMLEQSGYQVLTASTPFEAIRIAKEQPGEIQLIITDVIMPEMNGRDLAHRLCHLYPNVKTLFMSGYTSNVIARHGVLDKGVNYIQKPFSNHALATKVRNVLDSN